MKYTPPCRRKSRPV